MSVRCSAMSVRRLLAFKFYFSFKKECTYRQRSRAIERQSRKAEKSTDAAAIAQKANMMMKRKGIVEKRREYPKNKSGM